jgi:hypothetical protein
VTGYRESLGCAITVYFVISLLSLALSVEFTTETHNLGCNISYQGEKDIHSKITKFLQILGLKNNTQKPNLVQRSTRLKLYKTLALPTLLYGSEIWTIRQCDKNRLRTAEMKYLR